jgi:hypothetical protein
MAVPHFLGTELFAVTSLFTWLTPHIFIEISEFRIGLYKSPEWEEPEKRVQGHRAITKHSFLSSALCLAIISATAAGVALATRGLDVEMLYILAGLSRLFSAIVLFLLSFMIPEWLSIYYSDENADSVGSSLKALRVNIWWSILRYHLMIYFFLLPFFCDVLYPALIPTSIIAGIIFGFIIILGVHYGRTKFKAYKRTIAITLVIILILVSSLSFAMGCIFIYRVWRQGEWAGVMILAFFSWLVAQSSFHTALWFWSVKKFRMLENEKSAGNPVESALFTTILFTPENLLSGNCASAAAKPPTIAENVESKEDDDNCLELQGRPEQYEQIEDKTTVDVEINHESREEFVEAAETYLSLITAKCSCRRCPFICRHASLQKEASAFARAIKFVKWTLWFLAVLCCLFLTIVNIGGMHQFHAASAKFAVVDDILYNHMNEGDVCAFNETGTEGPPRVTTFESAEVAKVNNFTIAHCGKCAACSNPPNLKLQWTTRHELAELSKNCVRLAFFNKPSALQCFVDSIGFDQACSKCWLTDGLCSMKHCTFLYIQQMIVNTMTNFAVGGGMKNAASCEEAMCELQFVPCSGANRRRMNIKSDINRPSNQLCLHVNESQWAHLFGPY